MKWFKTKYRVVTDSYLGYEAQYKYWWMLWWQQVNFANTQPTLEAAKQLCSRHARGGLWVWSPGD